MTMTLYDVSLLAPLPSLLRPLVMPTCNVSLLAPLPSLLRPLVMPTCNLCEIQQELPPLVMPTKPLTKVAMRTTLNMMSWADMCESDVEDDDF